MNIFHFIGNTQWYGEKPGFVLVEMADRAGNGSTELQIKFESHGAEWSRPKWYGWNPHMLRSSKHYPELP